MKKKNHEEIAVGIAATLGFAAALFFTKIWFLVFPLVFVGLIPLFSGISKILKRDKIPPNKHIITDMADKEKEVLKAAKELHGRITILQAASMTRLSIEDARTTLDSMVKKGYINLNVDENGVLRYEFPDFFIEPEKDEVAKQIDDLGKQ